MTRPPSEGYCVTTTAIDQVIAMIDELRKILRNPRVFHDDGPQCATVARHLHAMIVNAGRWETSSRCKAASVRLRLSRDR
jgi:hypothetical protein